MKRYFIMAASLLAFAAIPTFAAPISFPECPAVGADTSGCELLVTVSTVNGSGAATAFTVTTSSPDLGPYDGADDTLVGILNSSTSTLKSIALSGGSTDIFGFDGDGACIAGLYTPGPTAAQCAGGVYATTDPQDYESAGATFSGINAAATSGTVNVNLAAGGSTWFDLEEALTASQIGPGTPSVPEPASLVLIGTGLSALYFVRRRKA